jgi:ATP-binding cassette, subfamily B, multidrug efflux pump
MNRKPSSTPAPGLPIGPRPGGGPGGPMFHPSGVKAKNTWGTLRRLWDYLKEQKRGLIFSTILVILGLALSLAGPYLMGLAIDRYIANSDLPGLARLSLIMLGVFLIWAVVQWAQSYLMAAVSQRTVHQMRKALFSRLQRLPLRFFDRRAHGELMSRLTNDIENVSTVLSDSITQVISSVLTLVGTAAVMLLINWQLALVSLLTLPLMVLITQQISVRTLMGFREQQETLGKLNGMIEETISGERVVIAYNRTDTVKAEFEQSNRKLQKASTRAQALSLAIAPLTNFVNNTGYALIAGAGGWMAVQGWVTVGVIAAFLNYAQQFTRPLTMLANLINTLQSALAGAERFFEVLDETSEPPDVPGAVPLDKIRGEVVFSDVEFGYEEDVPVLKQVSLHAKPGQTIALVGPTGAGKTTIINLLSRFYDVDSGSIQVDGHDIRDVKRDDLRRQLGIVLQDTFLFSAPVMENIRYGKLDATDEEVIDAAKLANADHFIRSLPHGYATLLSEGASNLSAGQRQLLAIARAILADPGILILDEATSSVDTRTEKQIQEALLRLMEGRTSFVIAHRLSTIREADNILVISDGEIVESGSHAELLAQRGSYYHLYQSQFKNLPDLHEAMLA